MGERWVRPGDLGVSFEADGALLVRAPTRGVGARVPPMAVGVLAMCSTPCTEEEVARRMGPPGVQLMRALVDAELLVPPEEADATPSFFDNFASLDVHRRMLADRPRVQAYARAIEQVVQPGMVVLDAGTGSGVLAALAARRGARVYAVDRSETVRWAQATMEASGLADRVTVLRDDVATVELPEQVDVVVTETFGAMALAEGAVPDLQRCVERLLRPGGQVIPHRIDLFLAPITEQAVREEVLGPFDSVEGVDFGPLRTSAVHRAVTSPVPASALGGPGQCFARHAFPGGGEAAVGEVTLVSDAPVVGLAGWYDLQLCDGVVLSTAPDAPPTHWAQSVLPLADDAPAGAHALHVELSPAADDRRGVELTVRGDGLSGVWRAR